MKLRTSDQLGRPEGQTVPENSFASSVEQAAATRRAHKSRKADTRQSQLSYPSSPTNLHKSRVTSSASVDDQLTRRTKTGRVSRALKGRPVHRCPVCDKVSCSKSFAEQCRSYWCPELHQSRALEVSRRRVVLRRLIHADLTTDATSSTTRASQCGHVTFMAATSRIPPVASIAKTCCDAIGKTSMPIRARTSTEAPIARRI